ncbi:MULTISPECIES: helix-turn-helix domain-containing protein [unclassified Mannheimia]|uniref:helix-turn-helix domain-containing protein n=1 Tax=unclassified Mannheimia TaxID=2645054 RepID=UPI00359E2E58
MNNLDIIDRMKTLANVREDQELAKIFGIGKTAVANWKRGTAISLAYVADFAEKYNCDLNWLITGESKEKKLDTSERMLLTAFADLDDSQKMQAVLFLGNLASGNPTAQNGGVSQIASGEGKNNNQVFHSNVREVTGIKK